MHMYSLLVLFLVCTLGPLVQGKGSPPALSSATIKAKDVQLLGADLNLTVYTFTFDQDLYLHKSNYCPAYDCVNGDTIVHSDQNNCVCDFTSVGTCGTGYLLNSTSTSCTCDSTLCDTNLVSAWGDISLGVGTSQTFLVSLGAGQSRHWRAFVNSTCRGFRTVVNSLYGTSNLFISNAGEATTLNSDWKKTNEFQKEEIFICPTEDHFTVGTYFIAVYAETDTTFNLTVEEVMVATPKPIQPEQCNGSFAQYPWLSSAYCLHDGVPASLTNLYGPATPPKYFFNVTFDNGQCTPVFVSFREYYPGATSAYQIATSRSGNASRWSSNEKSWNTRESFIICPENQETWTPLYITIKFHWVTKFNYRLTITTGNFDNWLHVPLASIPLYEVNFDLLGSSTVNTYPYKTDLVFSFNATSNKYESTGQYVLKCTDWITDCKGMAYTTTQNPFWPVPPFVKNLPGVGNLFYTVFGNYSVPVENPDPKSYSVVVVLSYETMSEVVNIPFSAIENINVEFRGKIGNLAGEPIFGNFTATYVPGTCDSNKFQDSLSQVDDIISQLNDASSITDITALRYKLDATTFLDSFAYCRQFVDSLTVGVTSQNFTIQSFYCPFPSGTYAFFLDPCCNWAATFREACVPRTWTGPMPEFQVQQEAVQSVCKNVDCSQSYLEDYSNAKAAFESGQCAVDLNENKLLKVQVQKQYLACKEQAFPFADQTCLKDSDCFYSYDNNTYTCSVNTQKCVVPYRLMETALVECLVGSLTESQKVYLQQKYSFAVNTDAELMQYWLNAVTSTDCVTTYGSSPNLDHRQKVLTVPRDLSCAATYSCASYECEDYSCQYPDKTCHYTCGMSQTFEDSNQAQCNAEYTCNWDSTLCDGSSQSSCDSACQSPGTYFCGFCDSQDDCMEFSELSTPQLCSSTSVCVLSNGTYFFNLTDAECDAMNRCDLPYCGKTCASTNAVYSSGICFSYEADSSTCTGKGGQWLNNTGGSFSANPNVCVFSATSNTSCASYAGATWQSCGDLTLEECSWCSGSSCSNITQNLMKCHIIGKPCTDSSTCVNSGICSDSDELLDLNSSPQRYGGCLSTRYPPPETTSFLYCPPDRHALPKTCMWNTQQAKQRSDCQAINVWFSFGVTWTLPAEDEATCLANMGCKEIWGDQQNRFSMKPASNCTSQYLSTEWTSVYGWRGGRWTGGIQRSLSWNTRQTLPKYLWNDTIDYIQLQDDFMNSALQSAALESKSAALCQYQRTLDPMQAVACDCAGTSEDAGQCFAVDPVSVIAQTEVCSQTASTQFFSGLRIATTNSTVPFNCVDLLISKISINNYQAATKERLLANFIPFTEKAVPAYPVFNDHGAVIGQLKTDGVTLTPLAGLSLQSFELCIQLDSLQKMYQVATEYPTLDFATTNDNKDEIIPLNMAVYQRKITLNSVYDGDYLCAQIQNLTKEYSYFAIERKTDYQSEQNQVMSSTAEALSYTLAAMFLCAAVITSIQLGYYMYSFLFSSMQLVLEHFLIIFIWLFVSVRTVYFFLIAHGLDSQVADYILVALPTFFYFTAFSIIVVLWAVVASKRFTNDVKAFKKIINRTLIGTNGLLYAIFVALVLAFQYANTTTQSPCSGRQSSESNTADLKRNISIAYGMIIAIISLVIGILFVVFGIRIRTFISGSQSHEKIFVVTAICSVGFILHSAFIVVVSFLSTPNLYFSFFGLIITEWFPAIFMISWLFIQRTSSSTSSSGKKSTGTGKRSQRTPTSGSHSRKSKTDGISVSDSAAIELSQLDMDTERSRQE